MKKQTSLAINIFTVFFQMQDFRMKMGSALPRLTKNEAPKSRTEFDGLTDLMQYLSTWGKE